MSRFNHQYIIPFHRSMYIQPTSLYGVYGVQQRCQGVRWIFEKEPKVIGFL
ncbi:35399_t:CDS:1, partial [Racocetra persica]